MTWWYKPLPPGWSMALSYPCCDLASCLQLNYPLKRLRRYLTLGCSLHLHWFQGPWKKEHLITLHSCEVMEIPTDSAIGGLKNKKFLQQIQMYPSLIPWIFGCLHFQAMECKLECLVPVGSQSSHRHENFHTLVPPQDTEKRWAWFTHVHSA